MPAAASILAALVLTVSIPLTAQTQKLGSVSFPNSGSRAAQRPFIRGVLLLHSFEYEDAAAAFREAQRADPGFALAYWGEAMTQTHPVWNEQNLDAARAILDRLGPTAPARRAKAPTARERGYLDAVEILYGEGSKPRRDTLYSAAMKRLWAAYPHDLEAEAFYALSLLGLSQATRNIPTYMRAGAIAEDVFLKNPQHPGAAHYIIHAFDDPIHAPLGLRAARAYAGIAPGADHARHMTSHIFVALGMWEETVTSNEAAAGPQRSSWGPGHYTAWLEYGYLQQGRLGDARRLLETTRSNTGGPRHTTRLAHLLAMRAHYLVNSMRWSDSVVTWSLDRAGTGPVPQAMDAFALGLAALRRGDRGVADSLMGALAKIAGQTAAADDRYGGNTQVPLILEKSLRALVEAADGRSDEAIALAREASALEEAQPLEYGPPDVVKPTHELLGDLLLAGGRAAEAQREFTRALELTPRRAPALRGLVQAAGAAGDTVVVAQAAADLRAVWRHADSDVPGLAELSATPVRSR
jgi:tetratricopeptide (TPR) repeat protein